MTEDKNLIPELTLEPTQAAAAEEVPQLTLDPSAPAAPQAQAEPEKPAAEPVQLDDRLLSDAEKQAVEEFAKKIDITDSNMILQYGAAAQKNVAGFSENALNSVRTKDLGEVGKSLSELVVELKGFGEEEEKKGIFGLFKKTGSKIEAMKAQYAKVESNVDKIARELEQHQVTLLKDVAMLDQMYELNTKYYKELTMYILAGKLKCKELRETELPKLQAAAKESGKAEDAQKDGAELLQPTVDTVTYSDGATEEVYGFDIPVPELDKEFDVALLGKKGVWYDHKVSVTNPVKVEE